MSWYAGAWKIIITTHLLDSKTSMKLALIEIMMITSIPLKLGFMNRVAKMKIVLMNSLCFLAKNKPMERMAIDACMFSPLYLIQHVLILLKDLDVELPSSLSFSSDSSSSPSATNERKINKRSDKR